MFHVKHSFESEINEQYRDVRGVDSAYSRCLTDGQRFDGCELLRGFEAQSFDRFVVEILGKCLALELLVARDLCYLSLDVALILYADFNRRQHAGRQSRAILIEFCEQLVAHFGAAEQICERKSAVYGRKIKLFEERID